MSTNPVHSPRECTLYLCKKPPSGLTPIGQLSKGLPNEMRRDDQSIVGPPVLLPAQSLGSGSEIKLHYLLRKSPSLRVNMIDRDISRKQ